MPVSLDTVQWIHGAADCAASNDPLLQVHQFDDDTFILRQSKCFSFEGPFMYLMFGSQRVVLFDAGAGPDDSSNRILPLRARVDETIDHWRARHDARSVDLIVAHTHSHGDHVFWDRQFMSRPNTTIVGHDLPHIKAFFGLPRRPEGQAVLDLGERELTILPLPGHERTHIAAYDRRTEVLLTGDTLYPGLLTVQDWPNYVRSAARLSAFAATHRVSAVLGNHIEMKRTPRMLFPIGTTFQPDEHPLPLRVQHLEEWHTACQAMSNSPHRDVHADFIIDA